MSEKTNFVWTDEEVTPLLSVVNDFKTQKAAEGLDWRSIKNKYEDLTKQYIERYPKSATSEFPKSTECAKLFTKERLCSKLKRIQSGFKKPIDSGRRSGGGRIVTTFYEECCAIWGGSPTVECTNNGIESCRQQEVEEQGNSTPADDTANLINTQDLETEDLLEENEIKNDEGRRSLLKFLHNKRDSELTKKVGTDAQLIAIAKEELMLKRKVTENMEESEKKTPENHF